MDRTYLDNIYYLTSDFQYKIYPTHIYGCLWDSEERLAMIQQLAHGGRILKVVGKEELKNLFEEGEMEEYEKECEVYEEKLRKQREAIAKREEKAEARQKREKKKRIERAKKLLEEEGLL